MAQVEGTILLRRIRSLAGDGHSYLTDSQLLQQFVADRDESAFAALGQRYAGMVLGVCRNILQHQQDAEDACQAAFLVLARKASTIQKQQAVSSWLHGVAFRVASRIRSQAKRRQKREKTLTAARSTSLSDELTVRELQTVLHEELHRLPEKYRAPLLLCFWEGKTRDEAAEQLGTTVAAFKKRLERARNLLGRRLNRRGFAPSAGCFTTLLLSNDRTMAASSALITKISQTAATFATGNKAAAAMNAAALAEGMIRTMSMNKSAMMIVILVFFGALGTGIGYQVVQGNQQDDQGIVANNQPKACGDVIAAAEQRPANTEKKDAPKQKDEEKRIEPRKIEPWDVLFIRVTKVLQEEPIVGPYAVNPEGKIDFGSSYGSSISVANLTLDEARTRIEKTLRIDFRDPQVKLTLAADANLEVQKIAIESRLETIQTAMKDGMSEEDIQELYRITGRPRMRYKETPIKEVIIDAIEPMTLLFGQKNDKESVKRRKKALKRIREYLKETENDSTAKTSVDQYIEILKLRIKVIDLAGDHGEKSVDTSRTPKGFQMFDERCKLLRKQISGWTDQMQELEMELGLSGET